MARVADHLSIAELESRFKACLDPVEARHVQAIWLLAQGCTIGATSEVTSFGTRWIEQLSKRYATSGPKAPINEGRRDDLKPSLLTAEMLEMVWVRLVEPPLDGGLWSRHKVTYVIVDHLGLERVLPQRGYEALKALGWSQQRPRPRNPNSAATERAEAFEKSWRMPSRTKLPKTPASLSRCTTRCEHRLGLKPVLRPVWAPEGQRPTTLGHHWFWWLYVTTFVGPATGETLWYLTGKVSKPIFASVLDRFAKAAGAAFEKRVVLLLDNAGFPIPANLAVPDGLRLVHLPLYRPELQPAETPWPLVDKPIVGRLVLDLDALVATIARRYGDLVERQRESNSRTKFAWWPKVVLRYNLAKVGLRFERKTRPSKPRNGLLWMYLSNCIRRCNGASPPWAGTPLGKNIKPVNSEVRH